MPNYLYNGVELPELPKWDKETYPYAVIVEVLLLGTPASWELYLTSTPLAASTESKKYLKATADGHGVKYMIDLSQDHTDWTDESDVELTSGADVVSIDKDLMMTTHALRWCNYDVFNYEQDTIYLAASYPINAETGEEIHDYEIGNTEPEPTLTDSDFYKVINGKWVKCDAVEPKDGAWVKQDEYLYS